MIPAFVNSDAASTDSKVAQYATKAIRDFTFSKKLSLGALLELAIVYYAVAHSRRLQDLADFLLLHHDSIHPSHIWCAQHVWAVAARSAREDYALALAGKLVKAVRDTGFNSGTLQRKSIEHEYRWAYTRLTLRGEEEWRIAMIYRLAFAIELGGSDTLPVANAEQEFQEHLGHLRALLGVEQLRVVERPAGKVPNPIF
jgi:hypothetical protein